jgi:hypothetical protein
VAAAIETWPAKPQVREKERGKLLVKGLALISCSFFSSS